MAARDEHAAARAGDQLGQPRVWNVGLPSSRSPAQIWRVVATPTLVRRQRLLADERLAQREVQVHRARAALQRGPVCAAGERAHPAQLLGAGLVHAHLEEPLGRPAEQLQLVDRLSGAVLAQLRRSVGGEHQQRHARLARLDHARQQLCRGRARRARHRNRQPRRLRQSEREEARAALVDVRVATQATLVREC